MKEIIKSLKSAMTDSNQELLNNELSKLNENNIEEAFYEAIDMDYIEVAKLLLQKGFTTSNQEILERLYCESVILADKELLEIILPNITNKHIFDSTGDTALHVAVFFLQQAIDLFKIEGGEDLTDKYEEIIEKLIDSGFTFDAQNKDGDDILSYSAKNGLVDVVRYLLARGVNSDAKDEALFIAAENGHLEAVKILLEHGVNLSHKHRALVMAARNGHLGIVNILIAEVDDVIIITEVFYEASENGHLNIMDMFIENRLDMYLDNEKSDVIKKALYRSAGAGQVEAMKVLLEKGASADAIKDALQRAAGAGQMKAMKVLLEKGASADAIKDALQRAAARGHLEIVKVLLEHETNLYSRNSALQIATENGYAGVVKVLLEKGASAVAIKDALQRAAGAGHLEIVKVLLEHETNLHSRNTALQIATEKGHAGVVKVLLEHGAKFHPLRESLSLGALGVGLTLGAVGLMIGLFASSSIALPLFIGLSGLACFIGGLSGLIAEYIENKNLIETYKLEPTPAPEVQIEADILPEQIGGKTINMDNQLPII